MFLTRCWYLGFSFSLIPCKCITTTLNKYLQTTKLKGDNLPCKASLLHTDKSEEVVTLINQIWGRKAVPEISIFFDLNPSLS